MGLFDIFKRKVLKPRAIVCDLDGTLCNIEHRRNWVDGSVHKKKRWGMFFKMMVHDTPYPIVLGIVELAKKSDITVIFCSGRPEDYRLQSKQWLEQHLSWKDPTLIMRKCGDYRKDDIVKQELYEEYIKPFYDVTFILDDRPCVVRQWKKNDLVVLDCGDGKEF